MKKKTKTMLLYLFEKDSKFTLVNIGCPGETIHTQTVVNLVVFIIG